MVTHVVIELGVIVLGHFVAMTAYHVLIEPRLHKKSSV